MRKYIFIDCQNYFLFTTSGFMLSADVKEGSHATKYTLSRVTLTFEQQKITSTKCTSCVNRVWCQHVIATVIYRIKHPHKVLLQMCQIWCDLDHTFVFVHLGGQLHELVMMIDLMKPKVESSMEFFFMILICKSNYIYIYIYDLCKVLFKITKLEII